LDADGGGAGKKAEPFVVVQRPAWTTGEWPGYVVVVDGIAIPVQVFANNGGAAVVAGIRKTNRGALSE
jgi:hypothetical protein